MSGDRARIDPHVKVLDRRVVRRAKSRGLDGVIYAPHFTRLPEIHERAKRFSDESFTVIPGREVFTGRWRNRKHVLAVGLETPVPDFITLEGAMAEFDRQGAAVLAPHPGFMTVSLEESDLRAHSETIDAIEIYNPKHFSAHNRRARALGERFGFPVFGSSYAHLRGTVGEVWTAFEGVAAAAPSVIGALKDGSPRSVDRRTGLGHRARCAAEFSHLFYENSISKAYKLAKGAKPTNPNHPAYEGRFDDVRAYDPPIVRGFQP